MDKKSSSYLRYRVEGSAVRNPEPLINEPDHNRKLWEKRAIDANYNRFSAVNGKILIVTLLLLVGLAFGCVRYVSLQTRSNTYLATIKTLQKTYDDLVLKNDAKQSAIDAAIDYREIYRIATEEYGMTFPGRMQILYYETTEREYVSQYEDIPET